MKKPFMIKKSGIFVLLIFIIIAFPVTYLIRENTLNNSNKVNLHNLLMVYVERVVDGDTIIVNVTDNNFGLNTRERVRLIGVDTPETVHPTREEEPYGKEASDFTKENLEGRYVYLDFDIELRDRFGRVLAYVYTENGDHFNARLVKEGFGIAYLNYPFKYMDEFSRYESQARQKRLGLWGL